MMPAPKMPAPPAKPVPPPGRITLWKSETGTEWLAFMRYGSFQTSIVKATREEAHDAMAAWWLAHTAEGQGRLPK